MLTARDGERLLLRNPLATAPRLRTFARARRQDVARAASVSAFFAAAPNPGGELESLERTIPEVTRAARHYAEAVVEPHATRTRFVGRSPAHTVVHFAGHVVVDPARPLFSALVFESGELLYVHELDEHSFEKARLVVLSACESGLSPHPTMSLANALLSRHVPSIVYTSRPVADDVAEAFAVAFHEALNAGRSRAAAVREAQLSLMRNGHDDAAVWAAFALAGTPGPLHEKTEEEAKS